LLVANPTAQSGKNEARIDEARALLATAEIPHEFLPTQPAGRTVTDVAETLREGRHDVVVAMGGDGTFNEVAKGLLRSGQAEHVRVAMLPTGTANDQGQSFGLSSAASDLPRNVQVIADGAETRLDAGRLRAFDGESRTVMTDYFFDSAGWGISPRILAVRNEDRRLIENVPVLRDLYRDHLVYAGAVFRTFLKSCIAPERFTARIEIDGERHQWIDLCDLVVKGTRIYGGLWVMDPGSRHDDGKFEVVPFVGKHDWVSKAIVHLDHTGALSQVLSKVGVSHSKHLSGSKIRIELFVEGGWSRDGGSPICAQIDGEEFPATPAVEIEVLPRAVRLIVPAAFTA
jgi:diacylglycerol kinase family enzyme